MDLQFENLLCDFAYILKELPRKSIAEWKENYGLIYDLDNDYYRLLTDAEVIEYLMYNCSPKILKKCKDERLIYYQTLNLTAVPKINTHKKKLFITMFNNK
tara:strand:- start:257 stop:559 length:303 start_codon:yes stop_codon:yes gene_type:complete